MKSPNTTNRGPGSTGGLEIVAMKSAFYRDGFRMILTAAPLLAVALLISICLNVWLATHRPDAERFAVDPQGHITPLVPLDKTFVSTTTLMNFVSRGIVSAYTMDSANYHDAVGAMQSYFTDEGFAQYVLALKESGHTEMLSKNSFLIISATPLESPQLLDGPVILDGTTWWKLRMKTQITYRTDKGSATKNFSVVVSVMRRPLAENPIGIGINQFVARAA